jgi:hypothetical protein
MFTIAEEEGAENAYQSNATYFNNNGDEAKENAYQSNATYFNNNGDEAKVAIDLLTIVSTFQAIPKLVPTTSTNTFEPTTRLYVEMSQSPTTPIKNQQDELVVKLDNVALN